MANHTSTWDALFIAWIFYFRTLRMWAGEVLYHRSPRFSWFLDKLGFIRVERAASDLRAVQQAIDVLDAGGMMSIFPEGRLGGGEALLPFQPGIVMAALKSGAPILPIYIKKNYGLFKRATAVVGTKIDLAAHLDEPVPREESVRKLCAFLADTLSSLKKELG
jgi:1-acyl-sn-glycerol-3-phosphate acyltransferase